MTIGPVGIGSCCSTQFYRGGTLVFATNFYDFDNEIVQPPGAFVNITYYDATGTLVDTDIAMSPPSGSETRWTAAWDTRGVPPGAVNWSIHSTGTAAPYAVEDGLLTLSANNANLPTF